jgi:hypothetical protein
VRFLFKTHKTKSGELLRSRLAGTILHGNYLIAQQLPASSPNASLLSINEFNWKCKTFLEKTKTFSSPFQSRNPVISIGFHRQSITRIRAYTYAAVHGCGSSRAIDSSQMSGAA